MTRVHLGLGSNLGDTRGHLSQACKSLHHMDQCRLIRVSSTYRTAPQGDHRQGPFLNAACMIETGLAPEDLLGRVQNLEMAAGRPAPGEPGRWGPRPLDVDILSYGCETVRTPKLQVPHLGLPFRPFVLVPLSEIDAFWNHPLLGKTPGELLSRLAPVYDVHWAGPPLWKKT